jgi:NADPH2:quinone reductase
MKAVRLHAFGESLSYDNVPEPELRSGERLVEVAYAGVNPLDVWLTQGTVRNGTQQLPMVPGSDASGHVDGRPVIVHSRGMGVVRDGVYRERIVVPEGDLVAVPRGVGLDLAAALGVPGATAWLLANAFVELSGDDRVLVLGASGGVGTLLTQLVANRGTEVVCQTSSPGKAESLTSRLGVEVVVADAGAIADLAIRLEPTVVFDPLGDGFTGAVVGGVSGGATVILYGTSAGPQGALDLRAMYKKGVRLLTYAASNYDSKTMRAAVVSILDEVSRGGLQPFIDEILPLSAAQEAHRRILDREVTGKILLQPER